MVKVLVKDYCAINRYRIQPGWDFAASGEAEKRERLAASMAKECSEASAEEPDAINSISSTPQSAVYFTIDGRQVKGMPSPGIYIQRKGDGSTRKVLVR